METKETKDAPVEEDFRPITLTECFGAFYKHGRLTDVTFQVGQGEGKKAFRAHQLVLGASSPVFEAMLFPPAHAKVPIQDDLEIKINNVTPEVFSEVLKCVYTDEADIDANNVAPLIQAAKKYHVEKLQMLCARFLGTDVNIDNAFQLFQLGDELLGDSDFALDFICNNAEELFATDEFLKLPKARVARLISEDRLSIEEIGVFNAVVAWGKAQLGSKHDNQSLKAELKGLLEHVRLPLLDVGSLANTVAPSGLLEQDIVLKLFQYVSLEEKPKDHGLPFVTTERGGGSGNVIKIDLDLTTKGPGIVVTDGVNITANSGSYQSISAKNVLSKGTPYWEVEVKLSSSEYHTVVGFVDSGSQSAMMNTYCGGNGQSLGWTQSGNLLGLATGSQGGAWSTGSKLGICIDFKKGMAYFFVNGKKTGQVVVPTTNRSYRPCFTCLASTSGALSIIKKPKLPKDFKKALA